MGLRARILKVLSPECGGERSRNVLRGLAGSETKLAPTLDRLITAGDVVYVRARGGRYRLPRKRGAA
jgi:hypothetical protein